MVEEVKSCSGGSDAGCCIGRWRDGGGSEGCSGDCNISGGIHMMVFVLLIVEG